MARNSCSCRVCWRARSASSTIQRGECRSATASTATGAKPAPRTDTSAFPRCAASAGSVLAASSISPAGPARQLALTCGAEASMRVKANTVRQPSRAHSTSRRSRQPIQRDMVWPCRPPPSPSTASKLDSWVLWASKLELPDRPAVECGPRRSGSDPSRATRPRLRRGTARAHQTRPCLLASTAASARLETLSFL